MSRRHRLQNYILKQFEAQIDSLSARGWGQGSFTDEGRKISVEARGALPGDIVIAEGRHVEDSMLQSAVLEFKKQHYPRIPITCPHAPVRCDKDTGCGGCTLRDCAYQTQCQLKQDIVRRWFDAQELSDIEILPILPCDNQHEYRNKMELSFGPDGADEPGVGLHPSGYSFEVIAMKSCDMISPLLPEIAQKATVWMKSLGVPYYRFRKNTGFLRLLTLRVGRRTHQAMVILTTSGIEDIELDDGRVMKARDIVDDFKQCVIDNLSQSIDSFYWTAMVVEKGRPTEWHDTLISGNEVLHETMQMPDEAHALHYEILPRAFFQPNTIQAEKLYQVVLRFAEPYMRPDTPVLDLYCGTGTIALSFARYGHTAVAVDIEKQAIENARENARKNGLEDRITFYAGDTAEILKKLLDENANFTDFILVVDPPRRGLLPPAYRQIMRLGMRTIVYVSCNPESLAADLRQFRADGYEIRAVQPVDMLPQTAHVETVALLTYTG